MTKKIAIVTDVPNAEFIVQAVEECGKLPEWVSENDQEKFLAAMREALSPEQKWDCFNSAFEEIERLNCEAFDLDKPDPVPPAKSATAWFSDFEHNTDNGPASLIINAVTNLYPQVSREQLLYMIWPYMVAAQEHVQDFFWRNCDCSDVLTQAHDWTLRVAKGLNKLAKTEADREFVDAIFSLALVTDARAYQDYCCLCLGKVAGQRVSLVSDFVEWGWSREWIDTQTVVC